MSQNGKAAHERCVGDLVSRLADNIGAVFAQRHRMKDNTGKFIGGSDSDVPKE
jgi:hypothetical protein